MRHIIRTIETEEGAVAVLPDPGMLEKALAALEKAGDEERAATLRLQISALGDLEARYEARERVFELRPYTYGEKLEARRRATEWIGDEPRMDGERYGLHLAAASAGLTAEDLGAMPPPVAEELVRKALELSEPNPSRLAFFASGPTSTA